jgi:putative chitinase
MNTASTQGTTLTDPPAIFDRKAFYDAVRDEPFNGRLTQQQVSGMEYILDVWEATRPDGDIRWLGYSLATTKHETSSTMQPIEEYGKGRGHSYGIPHSVTGQIYYGRGFVQLTWYDNYLKQTTALRTIFPSQASTIDLVMHPEQALVHSYAAAIMFGGMTKGSFCKGHSFSRYFNDTTNDPYNARDIINPDKTRVPKWSNGVSIGKLVAGYHEDFVRALEMSKTVVIPPMPVEPPPVEPVPVPVPGTYVYKLTVTISPDGAPVVKVEEG